jgi:hypothetical protein
MPSRPPTVGVCNGIHRIPFPAVPDPDDGDWRRRILPRQATAVTNFLPGTRRSKRKGLFRGWGYLTRSAGSELRSQKSAPVARDEYEESRPRDPYRGCGGVRTQRSCAWFMGPAPRLRGSGLLSLAREAGGAEDRLWNFGHRDRFDRLRWSR